MKPQVGVLALQGDFAAHAAALESAGAQVVEVRTPRELDGCAGLVIPGGESTTLLLLLQSSGLDQAIGEFHRHGGALLGTCAGAILLARQVVPAQHSLGLMDVVVERNAYGRQRESFEGSARLLPPLRGAPLPMLFIRAPRLRQLGPQVVPLAMLDGNVVLARQGRILVATGHPELAGDLRVHELFLGSVLDSGKAPEEKHKPLKRKSVRETMTASARSPGGSAP
ncbi:MAG: pyridoxal 5'-phosphate synthase glutaminase subunit PdxT [Acidobacteria bacterium]|nr:MAG: pyridoxal 5'-phosphate synthase glutaminase subunit PdxT [Acidobacteriota bacterium]